MTKCSVRELYLLHLVQTLFFYYKITVWICGCVLWISKGYFEVKNLVLKFFDMPKVFNRVFQLNNDWERFMQQKIFLLWTVSNVYKSKFYATKIFFYFETCQISRVLLLALLVEILFCLPVSCLFAFSICSFDSVLWMVAACINCALQRRSKGCVPCSTARRARRSLTKVKAWAERGLSWKGLPALLYTYIYTYLFFLRGLRAL